MNLRSLNFKKIMLISLEYLSLKKGQ